nr:o-succinylbenzoate synthase [Nakamurella antarctica]
MNDDLSELWDTAESFALPMKMRFRGITVRDGVLLRGPAGWAEFAPFHNYTDQQCVPWLLAAVEAATVGWPQRLRDSIEVNTTVPVVSPEKAYELVTASGCRTAKVKVADPGSVPGHDVERVAAVRDALGAGGKVRVDANGAWTVDEAIAAIRALDTAAGGLEYVEQPSGTVAELAAVRRAVDVPIAADESIRLAADPLLVALAGAADIAVLKCAPLGGVRAALDVAAASGLTVVVSSALDTSVGLTAALALAGALPDLPYACGLGTGTLMTADVSSSALLPIGGG